MESNPKYDPKISDIEKIIEKYGLDKIHITFAERVSVLIVAGFGLLATLAWDGALKSIFTEYFGGISTTGEKIIYALVLTAIATVISIVLGRKFKKSQK